MDGWCIYMKTAALDNCQILNNIGDILQNNGKMFVGENVSFRRLFRPFINSEKRLQHY